MMKPSFLILTVALSLIPHNTMATVSGTEFNKRAAAFAFDLYQHVTKGRESENVVFSPLSIHTALGLAYMGATGKTKEEMATVLRIPESKDESADRFRHVLCKYKNSTMVAIANKIYVQEGKELNPTFIEISQKSFKSEAENINFEQGEQAAKTINGWVESKTNNKIKDLINSGDLNSDTRLVLINAIHFKGFWETQFKKEHTRKDDFWISETESVKVDMMSNNKAKYMYGVFDNLDAKAVELPFKGEDLAMLIILPNTRTGLPALEAKLKDLDLSEMRKSMHKEEVIVSMPKFKIEFSMEMNDVLTQMGMGKLFSDGAELGEMLKSSEPLKVSKVIHKAFIDVNEEGAEAAAATGIMISRMCLVINPEIIVDHPFIYVLLDTNANAVQFIGSVKRL